MEHSHVIEQTEPEDVFGLLASDVRIGILQALWDIEGGSASFSDLHDAVDIRDSGQFNYHLEQLLDQFVTKSGDTYSLTQAGNQIIGAIEAGAYTVETAIDPIELDDPCVHCGAVQTFHYEDETVSVECADCPVTSQLGVPPSVFVGYDREELPAVASQYLLLEIQRIYGGFCPFCDGPIDPRVGPIGEISATLVEHLSEMVATTDIETEQFPLVSYDCRCCDGAGLFNSLTLALLPHPDVRAFYYDHGLSLEELSIFRFMSLPVTQNEIRSTDPFRASATYTVDEEELTVVVDETLTVQALE